ncbi:MAG: TonB-dependent receptor [Ignavibacteriaceae bacterium]|nr:TonB-dependent receptor [Ignavibacteriaceae bacterium]
MNFKFITHQLILIPLFLTTLTIAQTRTGNISGRVTEEGTGEVLIGANVVVYSDSLKSKPALKGTATNKFGYYTLVSIPYNTYYVFVTSIGYKTIYKKVVINSSNTSVRQNFNLEKTDIELGEIVIQDQRQTDFAPTTGTIDIRPEIVQKLPSLGGETDIFRALQLLPGVKAATEISTGIYVRGGSPDQNLTLVDGVVVYNPSHLGGFSSTFNGDAIQNISLIKGAFPAEYGGRLSSVLDVTLREGSMDKFMGKAGINNISSRITMEGPLEGNSTFILSGRTMYLDKLLGMSPKLNSIPRYSFYDFNGKVNYVLSETDRIFFSGFVSSDQLNEPPVNKDVGFDIGWSNATFNLTWTKINSPAVFSNTSLMYTNYRFSTLVKDKAPKATPLDYFTESIITDFQLKREMQLTYWDDHFVKLGAEVIYHDFNTTTSDYYIPELKYRPNYGTVIQAIESSVYAQDDITLLKDLKTNIGLRLYYFQNGKFLKPEPRASISYFFLDRFTLRAGFSVAHQILHMLSRNDIYLPTDVWYPSTSNIKPSRATQGSVGFEAISADRSYLLSVEAYYKDMTSLHEYKENADFSYDSDLEEQVTDGRGIAYGVELFVQKNAGDFTGWIGYTLSYTKKFFDLLNRGVSFYPRYDRRHDLSAVVTYKITGGFSIGATWTYGTGQAYSLPIGQYYYQSLSSSTEPVKVYYENSARDAYRLPPFHKLDISCNYETRLFENKVEFNLSIYNAYNRFNAFSKYIGYKNDPVSGRKIPVLKQFTLFPFLPTLGVSFEF